MTKEIIGKCSQRVPQEYLKVLRVRNRPELTYVPIDKTIRFFNEHIGDNWCVDIRNIFWTECKSVPVVTVHVAVTITEGDTVVQRDGIGSDRFIGDDTKFAYNFDPDKMVKTAYANALKKATNMFGFALELWDDSNNQEEIPTKSVTEEEPIVRTTTPTPAKAPADEPKPSLSPTTRMIFSKLKQETKFTDSELTEFLSKFAPESQGNPLWLAGPNENEQVTKFVAFVKSHSK